MGHAGRQFQALFWKNWLCRLRHPVLSLAEFFWPCILFMILTVLRFQEPPRHRDNCYLQARDLPSRGVLPFVQGLLCNTGSSCRNISFESSMDHHFRLSRFQTTSDDSKVSSLAFLKEIQDLAEDIFETMDKAKSLQKLWLKRSETPGSSDGSSFLTVDLNKTEDVILKLESFHQQPHIWDFLHSLPRLHTTNTHLEDSLGAVTHFLQAGLSSLTSLGDLDWLPLHQTIPQVSGHILNVTISTLRFLLQHRVAVNESVYHLSLKNMVWDPQKVHSDLKSQFGFNDLQMERILNYSAELKEIPTHSFLERMICSILSNTSDDEAESKDDWADCHPKWSGVKNYIIDAVSWLKLYGQVFDQWQQGGLRQNLLAGVSHSLAALREQFKEGSDPRKVVEVLHTAIIILSDSLAVDGPRDSHLLPQIFQNLGKLQRVVSDLSPWPVLKRLPLLDTVLRNVIAQDLHFVQGILSYLEMSAMDFRPGEPDSWRLEKDVFFWGLKQLLTKDASATCLNGHLSQEAALPTGNASIWRSLWGVLCHIPSFNETSVLKELLLAVKDAGHSLQEVIAGHTDGPVPEHDGHLGWQDLGTQLSEVNFTCSQTFKLPGAAASPENGISPGGCEYQLVSTVMSHILEEAQGSLQEVLYWQIFSGIVRKTCELAQYVNMHGSFQNSLPSFSEDYPCYTQSMDWKVIIDNYFVFFNNVMESPLTSIARVLNFTKHLLVVDKKLHTLENEQMNIFLSFVEFWEQLLPEPSGSFTSPELHNLFSLTELILNRSVLWINHFKSLERDPHDGDAQKLLEFDKLVIEKIQSLKTHLTRRESENILRFIELILLEINPYLREFLHNGISQEERTEFEISSILGNFSVLQYEKILSNSFNFSQLFHSGLPRSPAVNTDFIHLGKTILHNLYELSILTQDQVSIALDTIYALQNASELFSALSGPQKQELDSILTRINIFKDRDAALLLQTYSSFCQYFHKFLNVQNRESLIIYLTQTSGHLLDLIKQFNIQSISKALLLLSETTKALGTISEVSYCQQLLSIFNFLELQAQSLMSAEGLVPGVIHASLTGLRQLFVADEGFRVSLLQYVNQFFNGSAETLLLSECFILENATTSSVNYSRDEGSSPPFLWTQFFSNLSVNGSVLSEFTAIHCTLSWIQTWTEIWGNISQIFKLDLNIFTSLHAGIIQLLDELENDGNISKNCQGIVPTYHTARHILILFKNVTQENGFHDWAGLLDLRDLWVALDNELAVVQSFNLDQAEKSFVTMETSLNQLKTFPMKINASREFIYSLFDIFIELSKASDYVDRNVDLINNFLSNDLTDHRDKFASAVTELKETTLFLRNVSQDRTLLSCADIFQSVAELISEDNLLPVNTSKKPARVLAMLSSTFSSTNTSSLEGCISWIHVINHLCMLYNSSSLPSHLHSTLESFKEMENKMNSALKILTWALNKKIPICPLNESNLNCVSIYLKDITEFLNIIVTTGLGKEKVPKLEILLALFNDSIRQVNMIISNLTKDFEFASQSNWKHFKDLLLRPIETADDIPDQFQNIWQHIIALGKEMQTLLKGIFHSVLGNNSSSNTETVFSVLSTSLKERDISRLGNSIYHLANYFALHLTHDLQNSSEIVLHDILKAVGLGIQLTRDVFNSLMPAVHLNIPQNSDHAQVLKKVTSFMHSLKKADIELLVGQLSDISENLRTFFKNLSRSGVDNLGVNMLVGLVEKFVDSSHSWSVDHLLRLSRLLPKEVVSAVLDAYYALPHIVGLLQRVTDKNITESLRDIYNFTLLHGITMFNTTKEDFANVIKTLLDIVELVSDEPAVISEALMCLPRVWCSNHTASRLEENLQVEGCNVQGHISSSFYHMATSILDLLHLPRPSDSQCMNENSGVEITRKVVCAIHDVADWNSILSELLEIFHIKNVFVRTLQGLWHKVLPFMSPGNQGNDSIPELCPSGTIKQDALQIIEKLKYANFTNFLLDENMLDKLGNLDKILNITEGTETSAQSNVYLNLERLFKLISAVWSLRKSTHYLLLPITDILNANGTDWSPDSLSSLIKNDKATYNFEELWLDFKQTIKDPTNNLSLGQLLSDINKKIQGIALQNTTVQLPQLLEILDSSWLKISEIIESFLFVIKHWLHEYENEDYFRLIQRLFNAMASGNSTDVNVLARALTTYLGYLRNSTREGNFDVGILTHMLNHEQLTDFSTVQLLLESIVMNLVSNFAEHPQGSAPSFNGTDFHIMDFINLILNHTWSKNGGESAGSTEDFLKQLLETFFSLLNGMPENKISLLLKDFHRDFIAEMSFVPRDTILEILKLDPFLTWMNEDPMVSIFSSFRTLYQLIKNAFSLDNREHSGVLKGIFHTHPREPRVNSNTEDHVDFFTVVTQFLSQANHSEDLSKFNQNLTSILHLVRESSAEMANIMDILLHSPTQACHSSSPVLQHTVAAKLTELFSFVNNSFPLKNRETLESAMRLFGAISRVGEESHVLESALEISRTLTMLVNNTAELGDLALSVDSMVRLLNLAKKVSRKMASMLGALSFSSTEDSWKFFDSFYSTMLQSFQHQVRQITTFQKVDPFIFEKTKDLLMPFLDLAFGMIGVTPNISQDSDIFSMSSSVNQLFVNQSKDFSEILEEMAENLISTKISLRDLEHLVAVIKNRTQNFSTEDVNVWEEILGCLIPLSNITDQMDFLRFYELSSTSRPQGPRLEGSQEVIRLLDGMLTDNSTERETSLKMVIDLTLKALWNGLKEDNWDVFNLLLTFAQHPNDLLKTIESVVEASYGINSDYGDDLNQDLISNLSLIQNTTRYQVAKAVLIGLSRIVLSREGLLPNHAQWTHFTHTLFHPDDNSFPNSATGQNITSAKDGRTKEEMMAIPHGSEQMSYFQKFLKALFVLIELWQRVPQADQSVFEMCQVFRQLEKPSEAVEMLHRVEMMALRVLIIFAENPSLTKDILCAMLSCKGDGMRPLILSALRGVTLVHHHYQEIGKIWFSLDQLDCERLSRTLFSALEGFKSSLENTSSQGCTCQPLVGTVQHHMHRLIKSLKETWMTKIPVMMFLSNFTVSEDVKIKDLMKNITKLTEDLHSFHISDETIHSILEASVSHSKLLSSVLTVALSGKCDEEILHLLLTFPKSEKSWFATRELCSLPGSQVFSLLVVMGQNLNLRNFIYKTLIPSEANGLLNSLLDVISSLSSILARAQHALEHLSEFLHTFKITALLDMPDFQQVSQKDQTRSSSFASFQSVMKLLCKDQQSFLSNSNMFVNLPRVNELLEDDKEKFNIPHDSTPFCLKLYQEILQSPNGALVWSFLKPVLHGKILYTPSSPAINEVIQKANYTFYFVDKIKNLSETLLKMSNLFQGSGNGQMFNQLQDALRNKFIRNFVVSQLHVDVDKLTEDLHTYGRMLDKMFNHVGAGHFQFLGGIVANLSSCVLLDRFQAVEAVDALETKAHELMQQNSFLASVIFNSSLGHRRIRSAHHKLPPHVTYTIRTNVLYSMRTDMIKNPSWKFHPQSLPADGFKYNYIFVPLQDIIERAIIAVQTGQEAPEPTTQAQAAPYPCHTSDLFLNNVGFFFPLIMMLTWMVSVASMVRKLVYEREIQIEEYMRMMGLHPAIHFLSWFLENMATLALSSAALAAILKISGIFMHSDAFIIFLFLLDFGVSAVMMSYFLSVFFNQANTAALCTSLGYMISFLPYVVLLVLHNQLSCAIQTLLCLLSTTAFGQGVFFITFLEGQEEGIQWSNMYRAPEPGGMTFGWVCWMILFDSILYCLCGWYFSNLVPGTFGLGKRWYFPFTVSYWKSVCGLMGKRRHSLSSGLFFFNEDFGKKGFSQQNGPGELEGGTPGVALMSVTKEYEGHKVAVQELTLTFHRDQITALLGTNGAGKTTIISMLMGLYPPTSGTIIINGKNLQTDLSKVREELGVCPQQNVLLDNLTVREHLVLFASIKAPWWTKKELQQQVNKTLDEVELTQHQHKPARVLSGGMKRKLSIGIAFMGMSKTVVLDEPSSGVDPCSRRSLWDILLKYREGRTIIFTTHHLDEAEMLSDHVAVLQQGRLRCCAPPSSLKETYGQGLTLTLTKQPSVLENQEPKDVARVTSLIQVYIPQAFLKDSSRGELTYTIPKDADKTCFKGLCQALDQNLQHLHLTGYGISDTTLEEVFLMLLQDTNKKSQITPETKLEPQNERTAGPQHCVSPGKTPPLWALSEPIGGFQLLLGQAVALLRKRLLHTLRARKSTASDLLLPVLFVALAMGLFMVQPLATTYPPLKLTPGHYETAETYFFSSGSHGVDLAQVLLRKFGDKDPLCADGQLRNSSSWHRDLYSGPEFQKSCGCLKCPSKNAGAPYLTNCLGHTLLNLSGYDVEEYLLVPSAKPRLGGWSFGVQIPNEVEDVKTNTSKQRMLAKVWYNQKGFHSLPSYLNHLNNLILWQHLPPDAADWRQYGITLYSHPYGGALLNEDKILESIRQCGVALCIVLGFSILSASIGSSVVRDRVIGAKRLQHISGLGYRTYWLINFLYDMLFYLVSVCLCVAIIAAFQLTAFTFRENLVATALLLALFGYAMIPWMYLISRIFPSSDVAFISYISLNFIFGLCTMLMTTMPRLLAIISKAQNLQKIYDVLKWVFTIFPQFCLGQGLIELCYNQIKYDLTHNFGIDSYVSPFEMNFLGWIFVELALQGTILLLLRILVHGDLLRWPRVHSAPQDTVKSAKDIDVEKEQMRVLEGRTGGDILVLCNLSKSYRSVFRGKTTAVHDVSLGIPRGECFGLLGVNGAGKSTTFKILNGEIPPSSGYAVIRTSQGDMVDLTSAGKVGILFGYCPQQDALDELLTGWEHLQYYCSLRGIPKQYIPEVAADLVRRLHLEPHVDKPVATYSGGTRRKLSTALALVGKPDILLLDEPSSGMDPCSKRYLWQTISQEVQDGCAAVLTSHSMEECEALCTRLAIMVDGSFRCLGPPQHIKNRFGDGYTVKVWLHKEGSQPSAVSDCLKLHFPGIQFKGQRLNLLEYHVQKSWECLADLFKVLENNKSILNIEHYSISQTTLEQVFVNFATEQLQIPHFPVDPPSTDGHHLYHSRV